MSWFKQTCVSPRGRSKALVCANINSLANVIGTPEPAYGAVAIQSVAAQAEKTPYTELTKDDLRWKALKSTNVETQSFYLISNEGKIGSVQLIYNNVAYV